MVTSFLFVMLAIGAAVGLAIGLVGIGGVALVPLLTILFDMEIAGAIATAMASYIVAGAIGYIIYSRHGSMNWRAATPLMLGAAPGAFGGAAAVAYVPGDILAAAIAGLTIFAGANALRRPAAGAAKTSRAMNLGRTSLLGLGFFTGFASALTGTGGPVVLIPILLLMGAPVLYAIGLGQAIQVPIAVIASLYNIAAGTIDPVAAALLAIGLGAGVVAGGLLAHRIPTRRLMSLLALVLIGLGLFLIASTFGAL